MFSLHYLSLTPSLMFDDLVVVVRFDSDFGFGFFETITAHFSENWGFVSLAPMIGGNIFALAFGQNLDAHAPPSLPQSPPNVTAPALAPRGGLPSDRTCFEGRACYVDTLKITTASCSVALGLAVFAAWWDYRSMKRREARRGMQPLPQGEVLWEGQD